jgi:hypothetical protein
LKDIIFSYSSFSPTYAVITMKFSLGAADTTSYGMVLHIFFCCEKHFNFLLDFCFDPLDAQKSFLNIHIHLQSEVFLVDFFLWFC